MDAIEKGKEVVRIEARAVQALEGKIGEEFAGAVDLIAGISGRVVITGMGKSGLIARKIVATLNSTGTAAIYMHPSDAVHGDLGMVRPEDVVVCISNSGDTAEVVQLLPMFKRIGVPVISILGNRSSKLGRESSFVLDADVEQEACPYDLAPTASTTAALVIGDALAIALLERKGFTEEEFAMFHPAGNLGMRLLLKVEELMVRGKDIPVRIFELIAEKGVLHRDVISLYEMFHEGLEYYRQKEWKRAEGLFQRVLERKPDDGPSRMYVDRCRTLIETGVPDEWDGIYKSDAK